MPKKPVLEKIVVPVTGCTEPAAMAYAASTAAGVAAGKNSSPEIEMVSLRVVKNLFKNAMAVGIPNAKGRGGIELAAALGVFLDPSHGLNILDQVNDGVLAKARELVDSGRVRIEIDERNELVYMDCMVIAVSKGVRHVGEVVVRNTHDSIVETRRDGRITGGASKGRDAAPAESSFNLVAQSGIGGIIAMAKGAARQDLDLALKGAEMNLRAADEGLKGRLGLGVGAALSDMMNRGELGSGPVARARVLTAAACDARMSGGSFEIMASCGSGNQGIIASIPVAVLGEQLGSDKSDIGRALVLSHLMTAKMTTETSIIGAMCGCVIKAGLGAAAGCAWLLSKDCEVVSGAINNMAGNLVGEICDGAKVGCALKLSSAAGVAIESAYLASKGVMIPWTNGIVGKTAGETLQNIGLLASTMRETDRRIVEIMKGKG